MSKSKKDTQKFNLLLDGFLKSDIAQTMNPEELEDLLKTLESKTSRDVTMMGAKKAGVMLSLLDKQLHLFKMVVEDLVSVLLSSYRNGMLEGLVDSSKKTDPSLEMCDAEGNVLKMADLTEKERKMVEKRSRHASRLFSPEGFNQFIDFVENDLGKSYVHILEELSMIRDTLEASVALDELSPKEMQEYMKKMINKNDSEPFAPVMQTGEEVPN